MKDFPQRQRDAQQGRRREGPWSEKDYIYYVQHTTTITTHHHHRRYTHFVQQLAHVQWSVTRSSFMLCSLRASISLYSCVRSRPTTSIDRLLSSS